ncbi:hypothetical protein BKA93DRAFT_827179 [Sparassis latifolia]
MSSSASLSSSSAVVSTSSTPSSGNSGGGFFSANGTPALILAFLAIGLFVGGMVTMFALRRRRMFRLGNRFLGRRTNTWTSDIPESTVPQRTERRRQRHFGKKPELWDVYTVKEEYQDASWEKVTPISAKVITEELPDVLHDVDPPPLFSPPHESRFHSLISHGRFGFLRSTEVQPTAVPTRPPRIEVAVAIAMPVPSSSDSGMLEYSLGLAELPWDSDMHAAMHSAEQGPALDNREQVL